MTRWRSRTCSSVLAACSIGCSAKNAAVSSTSSGVERNLTESTMRTIVLLGNRSSACVPVIADEGPGGGAVAAVGDRRAQQERCVLRPDLGTTSRTRRSTARAPRRRTRPVRTGGAAAPAVCAAVRNRCSHAVVGVGVAGGGHDRGGGRRSVRGRPRRIVAGGVEPLAAASLYAGVVAEHADESDEQAAQLAGQVGSRRRSARRARRAPAWRGRAPGLEAVAAGPSSSRRPEAAQRDRDRLPHGVFALAGEPSQEGQQLGGRHPPGDAWRPRRRRRGCTARASTVRRSRRRRDGRAVRRCRRPGRSRGRRR